MMNLFALLSTLADEESVIVLTNDGRCLGNHYAINWLGTGMDRFLQSCEISKMTVENGFLSVTIDKGKDCLGTQILERDSNGVACYRNLYGKD